jgi:hypothetical protein
VVELLLAMGLLMLLAGMTLAGLGSGKDPTDLTRAAYEVAGRVERAAAAARADGRERYLVVAGDGAVPESEVGRAYRIVDARTFPDDVAWWHLPEDIGFANLQGLTSLPGFDAGRTGVLAVTSKGEFLTGDPEAPVSAVLELDWGKVRDGFFIPDQDVPPWRARILFRPRTGAVRVEEVEE